MRGELQTAGHSMRGQFMCVIPHKATCCSTRYIFPGSHTAFVWWGNACELPLRAQVEAAEPDGAGCLIGRHESHATLGITPQAQEAFEHLQDARTRSPTRRVQ